MMRHTPYAAGVQRIAWQCSAQRHLWDTNPKPNQNPFRLCCAALLCCCSQRVNSTQSTAHVRSAQRVWLNSRKQQPVWICISNQSSSHDQYELARSVESFDCTPAVPLASLLEVEWHALSLQGTQGSLQSLQRLSHYRCGHCGLTCS
jgi:hypothetical protein